MAVIPIATPPADHAFEQMFRRHEPALIRYCQWLVRNEQDALDVLQNVAMRAMLALRRGARPEREQAWLRRIAHNEAVSLLRSRRPAGELDETRVDPDADPAQAVVSRERFDQLLEDVRALPPRAQQVLALREFAGLSRGETAQALDLLPGSVSQVLSDARASLRDDLQARQRPCDEIRALLQSSDGRRRRSRAARAHLRGCPSCQDWSRRRRRPKRLAGILPLPAPGMLRWLDAWFGGPQGAALLSGLPSGGLASSRTLALLASLAGTLGLGAVPHGSPGRPASTHSARTVASAGATVPPAIVRGPAGAISQVALRALNTSATSAGRTPSPEVVSTRSLEPAQRPQPAQPDSRSGLPGAWSGDRGGARAATTPSAPERPRAVADVPGHRGGQAGGDQHGELQSLGGGGVDPAQQIQRSPGEPQSHDVNNAPGQRLP